MFPALKEQILPKELWDAMRSKDTELYKLNLQRYGVSSIHHAAMLCTPEIILSFLRDGVNPCQTFSFIVNDSEEFLDALDLALIYGKIENAQCLFENVREFQSDESLSVCYYHVITKGHEVHQDSALNWLLKKSKDPNSYHSDDICRPVHTAIQVKNNIALLRLIQDKRFDLCLAGNYHEPYGCLTSFQLALLYENWEAAILLTEKCNLVNLVNATSSEGINSIQFAQNIGKIQMLLQWVKELPEILTGNQQNSCDDGSSDSLNSDEMECDTPSLNP
ncbi:MAG: hypothetical protein AMJ43_03410 [Coxiella sp. DG_40]|nr:MAG: hypothetical protein AMJ43_03410 [Coxiella sp. DG_40]